MYERLENHSDQFDLQRLNDMLHAFLMMFAPAPDPAVEDSDIAWEDGEIEEQAEGAAK